MTRYLKCKAKAGQFGDEFAVQGKLYDGSGFSLFADQNKVKLDRAPVHDEEVDAYIQVDSVKSHGNAAVVSLPTESFESGRFITVDSRELVSNP